LKSAASAAGHSAVYVNVRNRGRSVNQGSPDRDGGEAELDWVNEYPLRERLRALLMQALCTCGCRAGALHLYRAGREAIVSELGLEPGFELQRLHHQILAGG
jgi:hypothetical protein